MCIDLVQNEWIKVTNFSERTFNKDVGIIIGSITCFLNI